MAFADLPKNRNKPIHAFLGMHIFGRVCNENGIVHKLTKPYHPWTNGQAERMNRTIKKATIKAFHYPDLESLKAHVLAFVCALNFAKHLKALRWKTPYQTIIDAWQKNPAIFKTDPRHLIPGPYSYLHSEPLRREINEGLNVVEQWNGATDFVFFARRGEMASNRREDHEISMLALHLIQNSMVYVNTLMIQKVLDQPQWQGKLTPRDYAALTPLIWEHVNPYRRFDLDMNARLALL